MMIMEKNPLTGDWLCYIPDAGSQAYMVKGKREATSFVKKVNAAFEKGELEIVDGKLIKKED